jgi:hypothetical protein
MIGAQNIIAIDSFQENTKPMTVPIRRAIPPSSYGLRDSVAAPLTILVSLAIEALSTLGTFSL